MYNSAFGFKKMDVCLLITALLSEGLKSERGNNSGLDEMRSINLNRFAKKAFDSV